MDPINKSIQKIMDQWNAHQTVDDPLVLRELHEALRSSSDYQTTLAIASPISRVRGYGSAASDVAHLFSDAH